VPKSEEQGRRRFALIASGVLGLLGLWLVLPTGSQEGLLTRASYDAFFRDRVVVVGARPMVGGFVERRDEFRNPLGRFAFGRVFMPAVEVHAT
jgi:hypothetical protein